MLEIVHPNPNNAYVRCYRLCGENGNRRLLDAVRQLESTQPYSNLKEIIRTVKSHSKREPAALFVHFAHLPPDLRARIEPIEGLGKFCRVIAFYSQIAYLKLNLFAHPSSPVDHSESTPIYCPGFPVTRPVRTVDRSDANDLSEEEIKGLLGDFSPYAGGLMFLSFRDESGRFLTTEKLLRNLFCVAAIFKSRESKYLIPA